MKTLRIDSTGGAAGDMILAALIDAGADAASIKDRLTSLDIGAFDIIPRRVTDHHFAGTRLEVTCAEHEDHTHRQLPDIEALISTGDLPEDVKTMARQVFRRLAAAEAVIHNTTPAGVAFHEAGALDSILDIVGSCLALHMLEIGSVDVSPLPVGRGTVRCAHGVMPLPVPATAELLKGHQIIQTDEPFELVTPTGAALLMEWKERGQQDNRTTGPQDTGGVVLATGYGFGSRTLRSRPNMLRTTILQHAPSPAMPDAACPPTHVICLECNLDDTVPELLGSLTGRLISQGALDVFTTPVQMKKQRPGTLLTVLCGPETRELLIDTIFAESTTFGIREYPTTRTMLERRHIEVETPYGAVRVKIGSWKGRDITRAPEHDDCVKRAEEHGVPVRTVYEAAIRAL